MEEARGANQGISDVLLAVGVACGGIWRQVVREGCLVVLAYVDSMSIRTTVRESGTRARVQQIDNHSYRSGSVPHPCVAIKDLDLHIFVNRGRCGSRSDLRGE